MHRPHPLTLAFLRISHNLPTSFFETYAQLLVQMNTILYHTLGIINTVQYVKGSISSGVRNYVKVTFYINLVLAVDATVVYHCSSFKPPPPPPTFTLESFLHFQGVVTRLRLVHILARNSVPVNSRFPLSFVDYFFSSLPTTFLTYYKLYRY